MLQELADKLEVLQKNDEYLLKEVSKLQNKAFTEKLSYNTKEAAKALGVTPDTIRTWIRTGKLKATKTEKTILIHATSLNQLLKND